MFLELRTSQRDARGALRPGADRKVPAALPGLRREDHRGFRPGCTSIRLIQAHIEETFWIAVSSALALPVTDAVLKEVTGSHNRLLEPIYPIDRRHRRRKVLAPGQERDRGSRHR